MKKVMLIGPGGSGKSTLSRKLGLLLHLPVYHLDALHWKPGWVPTPDDEWDDLQKELIKRDEWIIDGNYGRTIDIRLSEADTIIFFDYPRVIPIYRVIKRRIKYHGKTRPDLHEGCPERISLEFLKWIWNYKRDKRPGILERLEKVKDDKRIIVLRNQAEVYRLIEEIKRGSS
ncbi:DNA topology modulation protein [Paenibacillus sp. FSL W7-1287]|uniref:DNA topology modulation protein n=1 Tax=Paenibacillus sp. FSL W7-1287 TaxID=2954538 RepID=UPI0030F4C1C1